MKIYFKNLGPIKEGNIDLNKINIFCGENNTGKTYLNYLIYTILTSMNFLTPMALANLKFTSDISNKDFKISIEKNEFLEIIKILEIKIKERLPEVFSVNKDFFKDFEIEISKENIEIYFENLKKFSRVSHYQGIEIEKEENTNYFLVKIRESILKNEEVSKKTLEKNLEVIKIIIADNILENVFNLKNVFTLPAERSGLAIFYNELLLTRSNMLDTAIRQDRDINNFFKNKISRYSLPINEYINFLGQLDKFYQIYKKGRTKKFYKLGNEIENKILYGKYDLRDNKIIFKNKEDKELELYTTSSMIKTIVGIIFYLKYVAVEGDYFIIDEPELNLHPDNQRKLARIFSKMANNGINIVMTTHSPYIINEFNNLIMLKNVKNAKKRKEIMNEYNIEKDELISLKDINSYLLKDGKVQATEENENGIEADTFNEVIDKLNGLADEIYSVLED